MNDSTIIKGNDAILRLGIKDKKGNIINLSDGTFKELAIKAYTNGTAEEDWIAISDIDDNFIKLQSTALDALKRGNLILDVKGSFNCGLFSDGKFDFHEIIMTNIRLV